VVGQRYLWAWRAGTTHVFGSARDETWPAPTGGFFAMREMG
jgi:hypothetical protein